MIYYCEMVPCFVCGAKEEFCPCVWTEYLLSIDLCALPHPDDMEDE